MTLKEELKRLVDLVKSKAKADKKILGIKEIAERLKYDRSYFSSLLGARGQVTEDHIKLFRTEFREELSGVSQQLTVTNKDVVSNANMQVLIEEVIKLKSKAENVSYEAAKASFQDSTIQAIKDILSNLDEKK